MTGTARHPLRMTLHLLLGLLLAWQSTATLAMGLVHATGTATATSAPVSGGDAVPPCHDALAMQQDTGAGHEDGPSSPACCAGATLCGWACALAFAPLPTLSMRAPVDQPVAGPDAGAQRMPPSARLPVPLRPPAA